MINNTINTKLEFGKYRGRDLADVAEEDLTYMQWILWNIEVLDPELRTRIAGEIRRVVENRFPGYGEIEGSDPPVVFPYGKYQGMPVRLGAKMAPDYALWFYRTSLSSEFRLALAIKDALEEAGYRVAEGEKRNRLFGRDSRRRNRRLVVSEQRKNRRPRGSLLRGRPLRGGHTTR